MKDMYIVFVLLITANISCNNSSIEGYKYLATDKLSDQLYVERYYISHGVYGGGTQKYFITDSSQYRIFLCRSDDNEFIVFSVEGNKIKAKKITRKNRKLISTEHYAVPAK